MTIPAIPPVHAVAVTPVGAVARFRAGCGGDQPQRRDRRGCRRLGPSTREDVAHGNLLSKSSNNVRPAQEIGIECDVYGEFRSRFSPCFAVAKLTLRWQQSDGGKRNGGPAGR